MEIDDTSSKKYKNYNFGIGTSFIKYTAVVLQTGRYSQLLGWFSLNIMIKKTYIKNKTFKMKPRLYFKYLGRVH